MPDSCKGNGDPHAGMPVIAVHTVPAGTPRERLSDYVPGIFVSLQSGKSVKKAVKKGLLLFNGRRAETGDWVTENCRIELLGSEKGDSPVYEFSLKVLYEDSHMAVINKPAGIPVSGNRFKTIENMLAYSLKASIEKDALPHPMPAHRLDSQTSGVLITAKTASSLRNICSQFGERRIKKIYRAVVIGEIADSGRIDSTVGGRSACTLYRPAAVTDSLKYGRLSLVDLFPETGRTHQLRIHMSQLGHPIVGDTLYSGEFEIMKRKGLFLCAVAITFIHPLSGEQINITIDHPHKFDYYINREKARAAGKS